MKTRAMSGNHVANCYLVLEYDCVPNASKYFSTSGFLRDN